MQNAFPRYRFGEEDDELRAGLRAIAEGKVAPYTAQLDAGMCYPPEANDALVMARAVLNGIGSSR